MHKEVRVMQLHSFIGVADIWTTSTLTASFRWFPLVIPGFPWLPLVFLGYLWLHYFAATAEDNWNKRDTNCKCANKITYVYLYRS